MSAHTFSSFQTAIFREIAEGHGHTLVLARAGAGKTTTVIEGLKHVPQGRTVALFAFNKSIATELGARAPAGVEVKTLHSHGFSACRRAFGSSVDDDKSRIIARDLFGDPKADKNKPFSYAGISHLVRVAKDTLSSGEIQALDDLADAFDVDVPDDVGDRAEFLRRAALVFARSKEITKVVDFADMCWLPVVLNLRVWQFDRVFVDETQDLCPSQIELLLRSVRPNGRICAIGDDRQAIYGFRGASIDTIPTLIERLEAKVLPLSVTYRCAKAIVRMANEEVSDLEPAPSASEGSIQSTSENVLQASAAPGDMIISRVNAPLVRLCLGFLKEGRKAAIKGRNVGDGLVALIRKAQKQGVESVENFDAWVQRWCEKEVARLEARGRDVTEAQDKASCLLAFSEDASSVGDVLAKAEAMFTDTDSSQRITLGSTHRLKGLEAPRVWMLVDTYRKERGGEEANLWYVAVTRAKSQLMLVRSPEKRP